MNKRNFNVVGNNETDNQEFAKGIAFVKSRRAELNVVQMVENMRDQAMPNGVIINDAYCDRSMTRDYDRETMCGAYESCMGQIQNEEKLERWEDLIVKDKDTFLKVILQKYVKNKLSIEKVEQAFQTLDTTLEKNDKFITAYVDVDLSYKITNSLDYEAKKFAMLQLLENYIGASFFLLGI